MSIEQINAALNTAAQHLAAANGILGQIAQALPSLAQPAPAPAPAAGLGFAGTPASAPAAGGLSFGAPTPAPAPQPAVTADQIQSLITQLAQEEPLKAALTAEMNAMGIQNLGDTRPDQMNELYSRFQGVAARANEIRAAAGAQSSAPPSLI